MTHIIFRLPTFSSPSSRPFKLLWILSFLVLFLIHRFTTNKSTRDLLLYGFELCLLLDYSSLRRKQPHSKPPMHNLYNTIVASHFFLLVHYVGPFVILYPTHNIPHQSFIDIVWEFDSYNYLGRLLLVSVVYVHTYRCRLLLIYLYINLCLRVSILMMAFVVSRCAAAQSIRV